MVSNHMRTLIPPVRLSKIALLNALKYKSIRFYIDKLPTKITFIIYLQNIEEFGLRRIEYMGINLLLEQGYIRKWETTKKGRYKFNSL